jgi:N-acetylglucosamine-6-sulfatase
MRVLAWMILCATANATLPNVMLILTDDQDIMLGSMDADGPMQKTIKMLVKPGTNFDNAFVNTPICCPSRAEIQTARYMHNTKVLGNNCGGVDYINGPEKLNVAHYAKKMGYTTFYAGKYMNNYGKREIGGVKHIPDGWDQWYGLVGNSKYYNYSVSNNGIEEKHGSDYHQDYFTDRIANRSLEFLANVTAHQSPFFMMVATPASHGPNTPAPQYEQTYAGRKAPRLPSYNVTGQKDKHYLLRKIVHMDQQHANVSDVYFQRR